MASGCTVVGHYYIVWFINTQGTVISCVEHLDNKESKYEEVIGGEKPSLSKPKPFKLQNLKEGKLQSWKTCKT